MKRTHPGDCSPEPPRANKQFCSRIPATAEPSYRHVSLDQRRSTVKKCEPAISDVHNGVSATNFIATETINNVNQLIQLKNSRKRVSSSVFENRFQKRQKLYRGDGNSITIVDNDISVATIPKKATEDPEIINLDSDSDDESAESKKLEPEEINDNTLIFRDQLGSKLNVSVHVCDVRTLSKGRFLNDIILEFYLNRWFMRGLPSKMRKRVHVFGSPSFFVSITNKTHSGWTKDINIFEKDFVVIPINDRKHWFVAIVCFPSLKGPQYLENGTPMLTADDGVHCADTEDYDEFCNNLSEQRPIRQPCILFFDSLKDYILPSRRKEIAEDLKCWLTEEYDRKYDSTRDFSKMKYCTPNVPQQTNTSDCGLFALEYCERFFKKPIQDYTFPITHLEDWFKSMDIEKNCKKRREVQETVFKVCEELNPSRFNELLHFVKFTHN